MLFCVWQRSQFTANICDLISTLWQVIGWSFFSLVFLCFPATFEPLIWKSISYSESHYRFSSVPIDFIVWRRLVVVVVVVVALYQHQSMRLDRCDPEMGNNVKVMCACVLNPSNTMDNFKKGTNINAVGIQNNWIRTVMNVRRNGMFECTVTNSILATRQRGREKKDEGEKGKQSEWVHGVQSMRWILQVVPCIFNSFIAYTLAIHWFCFLTHSVSVVH